MLGGHLAREMPPLRRLQSMKIILNGEDRQLDDVCTLAQLVEQLGMKADRVAVERNRNIVPRAEWPNTQLAEGDRLEIVHFVGGGCRDAGLVTSTDRPQPVRPLA